MPLVKWNGQIWNQRNRRRDHADAERPEELVTAIGKFFAQALALARHQLREREHAFSVFRQPVKSRTALDDANAHFTF